MHVRLPSSRGVSKTTSFEQMRDEAEAAKKALKREKDKETCVCTEGPGLGARIDDGGGGYASQLIAFTTSHPMHTLRTSDACRYDQTLKKLAELEFGKIKSVSQREKLKDAMVAYR